MQEITRRTMINRSAAALGIAMTGSLSGVLDGRAMAKTAAAFPRRGGGAVLVNNHEISRDRRILFANIQTPGHVFAIQGPFRRQN